MKMISLPAEPREVTGKKIDKIRKQGKLPAVLYGHNIKNSNLILSYKDFETVYREAGTSGLVDLKIGGQEPTKVLIQEVQRDPVSHNYIHVDLHQIKMTEKLSTEIELKFVGESKAVKEAGGILVKSLTSAKIECLPSDLVQVIEVDITPLETFDNIIRVKDLKLPQGIAIKEKEDKVVVTVQPPRSEEELKSLEEQVEEKVDEVETIGKKKGEGEEEEAAEGEEKAGDKAEPKDDKGGDKNKKEVKK